MNDEKTRAPQKVRMKLPPEGGVSRYVLSSAQNNTDVHKQLWENLISYSLEVKAQIMVGTFTYNKAGASAAHAKRKTSKEDDHFEEWWDAKIEPYTYDRSVILAPGLVWCGELQILPTAVSPISGLESYTGRQSSILPHPKFAVQSIPSPARKGTKFIYTSGAVTLRNYIQKKAGQKAEFHHGYGAVVVEVDHDGSWFVRQLCADSEGTFYDLDIKVEAGGVTRHHRPEAIVWGDIHHRQLEPDMQELCWGSGGILETLQPRHQVMHDLLDFRSQNHHDRDNSWKMFRKFCEGGLSIRKEVSECCLFLMHAIQPDVQTHIVCSNHDEALIRWLREADFREDPENAMFFLSANYAIYEAIQSGEPFHPIEWAFAQSYQLSIEMNPPSAASVHFLHRDEELTICPDANGGIELGMHGDVGANGGRLTIRGFAKTGRKCIIGHSHSAGWFEGATQVGVTGALDQEYNQGMSSWSHTHALVYPNGKRTLFTVWNGKWRAL